MPPTPREASDGIDKTIRRRLFRAPLTIPGQLIGDGFEWHLSVRSHRTRGAWEALCGTVPPEPFQAWPNLTKVRSGTEAGYIECDSCRDLLDRSPK